MPAPLQIGTLLVASPDLSEDPNFNRTVVFITHYSGQEGAMGLVINRPLGDQVQLYSADELQRLIGTMPETATTDQPHIDDEDKKKSAIENSDPLYADDPSKSSTLGRMFYQGGPVHQSWLFFLHRLDGVIKGGAEILDGLYLGGNLDSVRAEAEVAKAEQPLLRFYLGYAGWDEGQLEWEISNGAWILAPGDSDLVFSTKPEAIWHETLYSLGGKYRPISVLPEDPAVN